MWCWVVPLAKQLISQICHWRTFTGLLLHTACLRSYHGLSLLLLCSHTGEKHSSPLSLGNTTFIIMQNSLPCRAEAQDHIIETSAMDRWCSPAAADSHLLVPTPECSVLPFFLPGSFTNPEFIDNYLHDQSWGGSSLREVGRSKQLGISNLPTVTVLACYNNELERFNHTRVISHTST